MQAYYRLLCVPCSASGTQIHDDVGCTAHTAIYFTSCSFNPTWTFLLTHLPWNFGFCGGLSKEKHLNSSLVLCPNSLSDYPKETWQNPCSGVIGFSYITLFVFVFWVFLTSNMTLIRSVWVVIRERDKHWPKLWVFLLSLFFSYNCLMYC